MLTRFAIVGEAYTVVQGWANSGPRVKCGPPQRFQWPAEAFGKYDNVHT